jgi:isopenicillin N synthase-like dioxygenase
MKKPEFDPESYPPFPSDVSTAPLNRISLSKLLNDDEDEKECLFVACKTHGFFYLELGDSPQGQTLKEGGEQIARVAEEAFALPLDEKQKYAFAKTKTIFG